MSKSIAEEINRKFEELLSMIEKEIIDELEYLPTGYGKTKMALHKRLNIDMDLLTLALKKMKYKGIVKIIMLWSESDYKPDGCGYCLTYKN